MMLNGEITMKKLLLLVFCLSVASSVNAKDNEIVIGETVSIHSNILDEDRKVMVYLPDNYENGNERYPVIYVLDGRDHFLHTAGAARFLSKNNMAPNMIVVAVMNTNRKRDMTTPALEAQESKGGGAENFASFIGDELIPYIEGNYRTEKYNILIGHSFAGFFTVYTLLNHSDLFDAHIAISPSLWWNNEHIVDQMEKLIEDERSLEKFLYITYCRENNINIIASTNRFVRLLEARSPKDLIWEFAYMPDDFHGSNPYRSIYDGLERLFKGWRFDSTIKSADAGRMREQYSLLSEKFGFTCRPAERWLVIIGYETLREGRTGEAIEYFEYYVEMYPESANSYDSLGEAFMEAGDREKAIANYERSLELDPGNRNAAKMLNKLRKQEE
jgi:predicted alpha/beta superfamily hydrolase